MQDLGRSGFNVLRALKKTSKVQIKRNVKMGSMKIFKSATAMMLCCLFTMTMASCDKDDDESTLKFTPAKVEVAVGSTASINISGGTEPYIITSSDIKTATATVAQNVITLTGVKAGAAIITVTDKKKQRGKLAVTVKAAATGLSFDKSAVNVTVGKEDIVTIKDGGAPYVVAVKDADIATATEKDGKITVKGAKVGKTTISVTDKDKKSGTITVTIK